MKVRYKLDRDKFVKVYKELNIGTCNVTDLYGLASKHDKTNDKELKDIMYAIEHSIDFEISDIRVVKKINNMYDYYDKLNRLTQQEIIDCIREVNELQLKLKTQTMATIVEADIIGKDYNNRVEIMLVISTNFYYFSQQIISARQGRLLAVLDEIKEYEIASRKQHNGSVVEHKDGFISGIFKSIFNWK